MNKDTLVGFTYGVTSSATFGLIPLFTLPVMAVGLSSTSIILYRFIFACAILALILLVTRTPMKLKKHELPKIILLAILYDISSLFLFWGYKEISSGVATAIHFMYPVFTTVIMMMLFKERKSTWRILAIIIAILGVTLLSVNFSGENKLSVSGIIIVLISALGYGSYLVAVNKLNLMMNGLKLTFYVFFLGGLFVFIGISVFSEIQAIPTVEAGISLLLLAFIPTILSNLALIQAIKRIGSTITSVLGAMEPLTAIIVGILFFHEEFNQQIAAGITLILGAVMMIILKKEKPLTPSIKVKSE